MSLILRGDRPSWPDEDTRLRRVADFCAGRAMGVPVMRDDAIEIIRYRKGGSPFFASTPAEYIDVVHHVSFKFGVRPRGMYATNAVYRARRESLKDCNAPGNVESYLGYIDIDNVAHNEEAGLRLIRDCLSKLPQDGVWLLLSGSGVHVNINGFKSHVHAQSFIKTRGVADDRHSLVEAHLLNDVSRIGTVPYEVYKKSDDIICFPFMPDEVDAVFSRPNWREYFPTTVPAPWHLPAPPEVEAWNCIEMGDLMPTGAYTPGSRLLTDHLDSGFWSSLPPCVRSAFEADQVVGQHRVLGFLTLFMSKIGLPHDDIRSTLLARNLNFSVPLDPADAERVIDDELEAGLEPPGCYKVRACEQNAFPFMDLGGLNLCPMGKDFKSRCIARSPCEQYTRTRKAGNRSVSKVESNRGDTR